MGLVILIFNQYGVNSSRLRKGPTSYDDALLLGGVVKVADEIGDVVVIVVVGIAALAVALLLVVVVIIVAAAGRGARHVRGELLQVRQRLGAELVQDS